jgi:hypothetical protein
MMSITLTADELRLLTGYQQPGRQLEELRRQGYWRARRSPIGYVILERAHYEAVCRGERPPAEVGRDAGRPKLRLKAA